jgi:hypothetical protein
MEELYEREGVSVRVVLVDPVGEWSTVCPIIYEEPDNDPD